MANKHKYSTIALIIIIGLTILVASLALESEDIDDICSNDTKILKRIDGTWTCAPENTTITHITYNLTGIEISTLINTTKLDNATIIRNHNTTWVTNIIGPHSNRTDTEINTLIDNKIENNTIIRNDNTTWILNNEQNPTNATIQIDWEQTTGLRNHSIIRNNNLTWTINAVGPHSNRTDTEIQTLTGWMKTGTNVILQTKTDKVGIGATIPTLPLHVNSTNLGLAMFERADNFDAHITFRSDNDWAIGYDKSPGGFSISEASDLTTNHRLYIETNGDIGIGTTNPDNTLHIHSGSAGTVTAFASYDDLTIENNDHGGLNILVPDAKNAAIGFGTPTDNLGALIYWQHDSDLLQIGTFNTGADIEISTDNNVEAMRILDNGNVGIGTSNPSNLLDITGGNLEINSNTADSGLNIGDVIALINLGQVSSNARGYIRMNVENQTSGSASEAGMTFWTNDKERLRIKDNGTIQIHGKTTINKKLELNHTLDLKGNITFSNTLDQNIIFDKINKIRLTYSRDSNSLNFNKDIATYGSIDFDTGNIQSDNNITAGVTLISEKDIEFNEEIRMTNGTILVRIN